MSLFSRPVALQFTEKELLFVRAEGSRKSGAIAEKGSEGIPEGALRAGEIQDMEKVVEALQKLRKKAGSSQAVLCLPPEEVYETVLTVSAAKKRLIELEIAESIPEERSVLHCMTTVLGKNEEGVHVGVIAVPTPSLEKYRAACKQAGFTPLAATTTGCALGTALGAKGYSLLANISDADPTVTLFFNGLPLDEAVLLSSVKGKEIAEHIQQMLVEYEAEGIVIPRLFLCGEGGVCKKLQSVFAEEKKTEAKKEKPKKKTKKKKEKKDEDGSSEEAEEPPVEAGAEEERAPLEVERIFTELKKADASLAGLMIASILGRKISPNFLKKPGKVSPYLLIALFFSVLALLFFYQRNIGLF